MEIEKAEFYKYLQGLCGCPINDKTKIFSDLGMAGLDTDNFMIAVSEKYRIDLGEYNHDKYDEGDPSLKIIFGNIYLMLFNRPKWKESKIGDFPAIHLYNVAKLGKWFNPDKKTQ
ncbi:MAG: DUF1493 family protein [Chitinophagaceae bacterium]|nr:DUF1493 family protein [Chitinophagaceae bacterium]